MTAAAAFKDGTLDPVKHGMLVLDAAKYCERAGIAESWLYRPAKETLDDGVIKYLSKVNVLAKEGRVGLALVGPHEDVIGKMCAMAAALVRAFVDARVMTAQAAADEHKRGGVDATVLLVPNFYAPEEFSKFDQQKAGALGDLVTQRAAAGLQTVVWVQSLEGLLKAMGPRVAGLVADGFVVYEAH